MEPKIYEIKVFKIINEKGLFSTGGTEPNWTKRGKTWNSLGALKSHLRQFCERDYEAGYHHYVNEIPNTWTVIEITNNSSKEYSAHELYPDHFVVS